MGSSTSVVVPRPRVVLADDHSAVLVWLRQLLDPHCDIVATAADGETLIQYVEHLLPDVVVTDVYMPRMNGLEACGRIHRDHPTVSVIVISEMHDEDLLLRAFQVGASAMLRKHEIAQELPAALLLLANS
jgi:DNA-binding NarL/FixJ family response regulator